MRARRPQRGLAGAVGDRSVQAAPAVPQRRQVQADLWSVTQLYNNPRAVFKK